MGWGDLSSWVKGGSIGVVIGFLVIILFFIFGISCPPVAGNDCSGFGFIIWLIVMIILFPLILLGLGSLNGVFGYLIFSLYFGLIFLLIGSFIGWGYGKIKSKSLESMNADSTQ